MCPECWSIVMNVLVMTDCLQETFSVDLPLSHCVRNLESVTPYCAENSHLVNNTSKILCRFDGVWVNGKARCECNSGYTEDKNGTACKALPSQSTTGYIAQQTASPSTTSALPTNGATHKTTVVGDTVTSVSREQTPSLSPSPTPSLPTAGTTEERTVEARARDSGGGLPIPILAGVGALIVVILALALVVVLVLVIVRNHRKSKQNENHFSSDGKQLTNPVYDAVSQNIPVKLPASNGNGTSGHKQDAETL
ncbi:hypothetical protein GBAR_LOCUS11824 [Geodia barretti]|nr:hypothetical protein GBAR_LOCUS11824 [Geodia barretti]